MPCVTALARSVQKAALQRRAVLSDGIAQYHRPLHADDSKQRLLLLFPPQERGEKTEGGERGGGGGGGGGACRRRPA